MRSHIPAGDAVCDTSTSYDMADDVLTQTGATGATSSYTYDGRGKTLTVTTPRDANTSLLTRVSYDADGNTVLTCAPMSVGATPASPTACTTANPYAVFAGYDQQDRAITASQYRATPAVHAVIARSCWS